MSTKDKILDTALELFNTQGIEAVTVRHVAQAMGISHGNLQYHYANTDLIIQALYDRLASRFDAMLVTPPDKMNAFRQSVTASFELIYEFRFIFLHFVEIGRRIPAITKHYKDNLRKREPQFLYIFNVMQQQGIMRKDIPEDILKLFVHQLFIVTDFWLSSNEITLQLKEKKALKYYSGLFWGMFYPYFTAKGLKEFAD
ncbi:TetR/AcrR family transcriptional regulator [Chitinophaga niabensis]|uniref:DNA-binding transcriptional regulator, AcrR family n=1 Tax=Chitinophaga niabensis TaxID=536979 RepID=A0A1N6G0N4_9BACT|nr:TetR/AcrR family transcriptional regulator [Chitinophaga niabensis]SIO01002.1 DNA-binding transcriptional regulator, AcrR family [Chitinophaga niabensis]